MAILGRKTGRRRLRGATRESLSVPIFRTPADATPWVLGGLWPAELQAVTGETATLAAYLRSDLDRIANSANEKLRAISETGLAGPARQAEEARVIKAARAFAARRVQSTVWQLRKEAGGSDTGDLRPNAADVAAERRRVTVDDHDTLTEPVPHGQVAMGEQETAATQPPESAQPPAEDDLRPVEGDSPHTAHQPEPSVTEPVAEVTPEEPTAADTLESDRQRLQRLVEYVARQEPRLRWAAGKRRDGTVVLATDLAHGWIPPWVDLPAGVELLSPQRRSGGPAALLGPTEIVATYTPGDPFSGASDSDLATPSGEARQAPPVDDLGHQLAQATLRRDGLPEFVHTLAKGGAAGSDVVTVQIQILRLLLDAARHRLLAQYHQVESTDLLNCLLLAATEGIATGDSGSANYHFAWFQALSS